MRTFAVGVFAFVMIAIVTAGAPRFQTGGSPSDTMTAADRVTAADYERWKKELSNWGRWGKDDQIGVMNLITRAKRKQAAALVKDGISVSMASDANTEKSGDNLNPYEHVMLGLESDRIGVAIHGIAHTHLDALVHNSFSGVFYNGYAPDKEAVMKANGHARNSIHNLKNGVFTRGVLIDIPRLKGVPYLELGTPIYVKDLEAFEKMAGIKVSAGDALFIRTGIWSLRAKQGPGVREGRKSPGLHASVIPWLRQRDIALLGTEHPQIVVTGPIPASVHQFSSVILGVHLIDNANLEAVADAAAARKRWEFLLTAAPLPIVGGTGSPINPIATF